MAGVHVVPGFTQSDDEATDMASGPTSPVILETPDPATFMEISRYFEAAHGMLGNSSKVYTAAESDSGDLSVTAPVQGPQAHRYRRRPQSEATTASGESEGETLSSYQPGRSPAAASRKRVKGRKKWSFQAYRAPFLESSSFNATLSSGKRGRVFTVQQEARLKTCAVGGFFKCIRSWHRINQGRYPPASSLPAVYMDADEPLSPLSEGNETSDDDGIKVVGNEFFVKSTKRKCPRRQGRAPSSSQTKNLVRTKTVKRTKTTKRAKAVRGRGSRPVHETGSRDRNGPSSPPHPTQPEEEEAASVESTQPKDHLVIESASDSAVLEESSGLVLQRDSSSDVTSFQEVNRPPATPCTDDNISAGGSQPDVVRESACISSDVSERKTTRTNKSKKKICQMARESGEVAVELAPGVADEHENNNDNDDDAYQNMHCRTKINQNFTKIKKRKKEKKRKVAEEEDVDISFAGPWPASETPDISQPSSESTVAINNHKEDDDDEEYSKIKKRKKEVAEEVDIPLDGPALERTKAGNDYSLDGSVDQLVNLDIVFTHKVNAPAETATVAFKKRKGKKEKMAPCPEDPETHPETENAEGVNPFKRPADQEVALEDAALETPDVSRKTLGSGATTVPNGGNDEEHRIRKKKKKEKKRKVTEKEKRDISFDGPCRASETPNISLASPESTVAINNHKEDYGDDEEHRKMKKRKKEVAEEVDKPLDGPALETSDISQRTSVSTLTFNNKDYSLDGSVGQLVNVDNVVSSHEVKTATVAFKKRKRKKEKMAPCPEDPETHPEAENTEGVNPFKRPADQEVALEDAALETPDVSRKTLGSAATIALNGDEEHIRKKKKKAKKRDISLDGPCPASETPDISLPSSESTVAINNHKEGDDDEEEHSKIKKRKKKKRKVTEEEKRDISLDGPCPASETPDISLPSSESTVAINNHKEGDDDEEEHSKIKKRKKKKRKVTEEEKRDISLDGPCPASETPDISLESAVAINNHKEDGDDDEEHKKIKKRKKEKKREFAEEEDVPCPWPALETPDISQPASVPTLTFNNDADHSIDGSAGQVEDLWKPRKKSKKNKGRMTNGAVAEVDAETSALTETAAVGFKKRKRKKDKTAPCPENPETNPEAKNTEIEENPPEHPADQEVESPRKKRRKQKMAETSQCASAEDTLVEGSGSTSARGEKRKHSHSFLSDDTVENHPETKLFVAGSENRRQKNKNKDKRVSASDIDREPVENGETPVESLTGPCKTVETKKKKKREREASSASVLEGNESCEGGVLGVRSSAETGDDGVQMRRKKKKEKKKKDKKADRESESPMGVERETPDDIETAVLMKKKDKCKRNPHPPPQGSTPTWC